MIGIQKARRGMKRPGGERGTPTEGDFDFSRDEVTGLLQVAM